MRFRKKPELVDAVQWTGNNMQDIRDLVQLGPPGLTNYCRDMDSRRLIAENGDGVVQVALPGDWVVRSSDGTLSTCNQLTFAASYEAVPPSALPWIDTHRKEGA